MGPLNTDSLVTWINKNSNPLIIPVNKCEELGQKLTYSSLSLAFFGESKGEMYHSFARAARANSNFMYFQVSLSCTDEYQTEENSIVAFRSFGRALTFGGEPSFAQIMVFMDQASLPALIEWSDRYHSTIFDQKRTAIVLFSYYRDSEYALKFEEIANELEG